MGQEKQIREAIRTIAGTNQVSSLLFSAVVTEVDGDVCSVMHDSLEISGVKLRAIKNEEKNFLIVTPAKDSIVLVADLSNGYMRDLCVVQYSQIDKVELSFGDGQALTIEGGTTKDENGNVTNDGVMFNGGTNGLVQIKDLTSKLNDLVSWCKTHTHSNATFSGSIAGSAASGSLIVPAPASGPDKFDQTDYENTKIKH